METGEIRQLSDGELEERVGELKQELFNLRFRLVTGQLDNYKQLKQTRREIARVRTIQRERQLAAQPGAVEGGGAA